MDIHWALRTRIGFQEAGELRHARLVGNLAVAGTKYSFVASVTRSAQPEYMRDMRATESDTLGPALRTHSIDRGVREIQCVSFPLSLRSMVFKNISKTAGAFDLNSSNLTTIIMAVGHDLFQLEYPGTIDENRQYMVCAGKRANQLATALIQQGYIERDRLPIAEALLNAAAGDTKRGRWLLPPRGKTVRRPPIDIGGDVTGPQREHPPRSVQEPART